jgi:hypothetical protein
MLGVHELAALLVGKQALPSHFRHDRGNDSRGRGATNRRRMPDE